MLDKDMLSKRYEYLETLKVLANAKHWNNSARGFFGWNKVPDGIKQIRKLLLDLPPRNFDILTQEEIVNKLFVDVMQILREKQSAYKGLGKRLDKTQDFYNVMYRDGLDVEIKSSRRALSSE